MTNDPPRFIGSSTTATSTSPPRRNAGRSAENDVMRQKQETLGSLLLGVGMLLIVLNGVQAADWLPASPRFWVENRAMWWLLAFGSIASGMQLLSQATLVEARPRIRWRPELPGKRFRQVVLYTRENCGLCDEAAEILEDHAAWLPEIQEVDIDGDPLLKSKFDTIVPVVACDQKLRFRGRVSEILLRRLINATPPV